MDSSERFLNSLLNTLFAIKDFKKSIVEVAPQLEYNHQLVVILQQLTDTLESIAQFLPGYQKDTTWRLPDNIND